MWNAIREMDATQNGLFEHVMHLYAKLHKFSSTNQPVRQQTAFHFRIMFGRFRKLFEFIIHSTSIDLKLQVGQY
jgi:hypothetical protein